MRLLLDTHVFLWSVSDSRQLTAVARAYVASAQTVYVSAASIWEIASKSQLGKIDGDPDELVAAIRASGFQELPVSAAHAAAVAKLPQHHSPGIHGASAVRDSGPNTFPLRRRD